MARPKLAPERVELIKVLLSQGMTQPRIATTTGVSLSKIQAIKAQYKNQLKNPQRIQTDFQTLLRERISVEQILDNLVDLANQRQHPLVSLKTNQALLLYQQITDPVQEAQIKRDTKQLDAPVYQPMIRVDTYVDLGSGRSATKISTNEIKQLPPIEVEQDEREKH